MQIIIHELLSVVREYRDKIQNISDSDFTKKPLPNKWSKIEVLGHLVDSAHNNLRRFVCGQYESEPPKIVYDQDFWVVANDYSNLKKADVLQLWTLLNERIANVLRAMPKTNYTKQCDTGKGSVQLRSLEWLAADYLKHMKHHLNQILPGSFDIIYP
jgi:hypothetical protein